MNSRAANATTLLLICSLLLTYRNLDVLGADPAVPEASTKLQYLIDRFDGVRIQPTKRQAEDYKLRTKPLMEWHNPISGAEGAVFVWTADGRPMVFSKCDVNDVKQHFIQASTSVALEPFVIRRGAQAIWTCPEPGVTFRKVADGGAPADREPARLIQMRAIARQYRFMSIWGEDQASEWELRLLPTPLYRYASSSAMVIDGAIFGYAQGTNPEGIVIVEAVQSEQGPVWQVAAARLTGYALKGWLNDMLVLDVPDNRTHGPFLTHYHVYERPMPYPFPKKQSD